MFGEARGGDGRADEEARGTRSRVSERVGARGCRFEGRRRGGASARASLRGDSARVARRRRGRGRRARPAPRDDSGRAAPSVSSAHFKGERATRGAFRETRRGRRRTFAIHASRSRPLPIVDVVRGVVRVRSPTRRARVCLRGAGPHTLGRKRRLHTDDIFPRWRTSLHISHTTTSVHINHGGLVGHAAGRHTRARSRRWTTSPRSLASRVTTRASSRTPPPRPPLVLSDTFLVLSDTLLVLSATRHPHHPHATRQTTTVR